MDIGLDEYMKYINHRFTVRIFQSKFPRDHRCSSCGDGVLEYIPEDFHKYETKESAKHQHHDNWDPEWIEYIFTGALRCQSCSETYIVTGTGKVEHCWDPECGQTYEDVFFPKFFLPAIHIFSIPKQTPIEVAKIIEASFSLAWVDYSAAGNKLRVALELIVDELVPNSKLSLGRKINNIPEEKSNIKDMINAIKWLGNQSSHAAELAEYDLAFSFKIIERVLIALYPDPDDTEILITHVKMVNNAKGSFAKE